MICQTVLPGDIQRTRGGHELGVPAESGGGWLHCRLQPVRLAGCWWLVLICSERKVLLTGLFWEKSNVGWWLINQTTLVRHLRGAHRLQSPMVHPSHNTRSPDMWLRQVPSSCSTRAHLETFQPRLTAGHQPKGNLQLLLHTSNNTHAHATCLYANN
jgi:hypothetical protein